MIMLSTKDQLHIKDINLWDDNKCCIACNNIFPNNNDRISKYI